MHKLIDQPLLARILQHESDYWSTIAQVEQHNGWKSYTNPAFAPRIDPNHAGDFRTAAGEAPRIVAEISATFRSRNLTPAAYVDLLAPDDLVPALLQAGFQEWSGATNNLLLYDATDQRSATPVSAAAVSVTVVESEEDRQAWAGIMEETTGTDERPLLQQLYYTEICDPRITAYLVRVDGEPACRAELFSADGLGRVEAVRTAERFRSCGLASAAIRTAIRDSQRQGNQLTYIYCEPDSAAQRLYQKLGFVLAAELVTRSFC